MPSSFEKITINSPIDSTNNTAEMTTTLLLANKQPSILHYAQDKENQPQNTKLNLTPTSPQHTMPMLQTLPTEALQNHNRLREARDLLKQNTTEALSSLTSKPKQFSKLYAGSKFRGTQKSGRSSYQVNVVFQHVDFSQSFACGYLQIEGLTDEYPHLTTYFEAEIIGDRHKFLTRKWEATEEIDKQHWMRFPAFKGLEEEFNKDSFQLVKNSRFIFMRWKELFLVPNHRIKSINGASFSGFYYICFDLLTGTINGFYFHQNSEWFQSIDLEYVPDQSFGSFEFR